MSSGPNRGPPGVGDEDEDEYVMEKYDLEVESDEDMEFEEVPEEFSDEDSEVPEEEDLDEDIDATLNSLRKHAESTKRSSKPKAPVVAPQAPRPEVVRRPEVIDDFIRNFLIHHKMERTLEAFQTEWYEKEAKGELPNKVGTVPDVYLESEALKEKLEFMEKELARAQEVAEKAKSTWDKLRKERDMHRMHHHRVLQEKNKLVGDLRRMRAHVSKYEPAMEELKRRYEASMKEKMLARLERDKMRARIENLELEVQNEQVTNIARGEGPSEGDTSKSVGGTSKSRRGKDSTLPPDEQRNPFLEMEIRPARVDTFTQSLKNSDGHTMSVSCLAMHPRKNILVTGSDDTTWKMWSLEKNSLIMSGEGHKGWLSCVKFHPRGTHLASSAGDSTVKLWDFSLAKCVATYTDHTQAVWGCAFHDAGDFLATCSLDHTVKLIDVNTSRCRQTYRGHVDSVNSVVFQPFSNNLCTASGDKTVSLWDARSGLCIQTFYGHTNACNHAVFNLQGDTIASTDADGVVKLWDVRMVSERAHAQLGDLPANKCTFDPSGKVLAVASDDHTVKVFDSENLAMMSVLSGHTDCVQDAAFEQQGAYLVSGGSDSTWRVWGRVPPPQQGGR